MARNSSRPSISTDSLKDGKVPPPDKRFEELCIVNYATNEVTPLPEFPTEQAFDLTEFSHSDKKLIVRSIRFCRQCKLLPAVTSQDPKSGEADDAKHGWPRSSSGMVNHSSGKKRNAASQT